MTFQVYKPKFKGVSLVFLSVVKDSQDPKFQAKFPSRLLTVKVCATNQLIEKIH